jgi:murein DD-endopeptidase MepM/ murein hydrolase activator NlpD
MRPFDRHAIDPGDEPALLADGRRRAPDRREISTRWLTGTFLTGITSSILMGVALFAALDGREQLATPPELMARGSLHGTDELSAKGSRVAAVAASLKNRDRRRLDVSTIIREGERDVIRTLPFEDVRMTLAASPPATRKYPAFNPRNVFADDDDDGGGHAPMIYGADVDSEVTLRTLPFPLDTTNYDTSHELTSAEVEQVVQETAGLLTDGAVQAAALQYVDPLRFGDTDEMIGLRSGPGFRVTPENVSVTPRDSDNDTSGRFTEDLVPFHTDKSILDALSDAGYDDKSAEGMAEALSKLLNTSDLKAGSTLRIGVENSDDQSSIVRASVYRGSTHIVTVALDDNGRFVPAEEPEVTPAIEHALDNSDSPAVADSGDLPSVYDGIYRSALAYGMTDAMIKRLIRILAPDVDLQTDAEPSDQLQVLFSLPGKEGDAKSDAAGSDSEILYVAANFGGQTRDFYRFRSADGTLDYYDQEGKSARQFLLRNPVPGARFSRPFGMMRHPILGIMKMHTGDDWAIARGTPIMAAGNGVIERAGWSSGYGNMTVVRHANGYETVYAHQAAFAKGIAPGVHVHQGQVIGYVGSTGLSTGPHVHFEIRINDQPVDPLRVRLPHSHSLSGDELQAFERERKRIDAVLESGGNRPSMNVASR